MLLLATLALAPCTSFGDFERADEAFIAGDYVTAAKLFRPLAEQGDAYAQYNLGKMYVIGGQGVPEDDKEAVKWYRLAAEQGVASAQYNLGNMYRTGRGVLRDSVQAYVWFNIAGANGYKDANDLKSKLKLTQASIEKAQALSRKMVEENPKLLGAE